MFAGDKMVFRALIVIVGIACTLGHQPVARAGSIVAIVEEIDADTAGVSAMQYLAVGQTVSLGPSGRAVVGYLNSCLREEIVGGTVTIGVDRSVVSGGLLTRNRVECDGGKLMLTAEQAERSGVLVFRRGRVKPDGASSIPSLRIFSLTPIIRTEARPGNATIKRIDRPEPPITLTLKNGIADMATLGKSLVRGGIYRVNGGGRERVFQIDVGALKGGPVISRYVEF